MKKYISIILVVFVLAGCERQEDVDIDVPYKKKLVAAVFIGAGDSLINATLTYTTPVFGAVPAMDAKYATSATGVLSYNGLATDFNYDSMNLNYTAFTLPHYALAGETYQVNFDDKELSINGKTTIPFPVTMDIQMEFDSSENLTLPQYRATFTCRVTGDFPAYVRIFPVLVMDDSLTFMPMYGETFKPIKQLQKGDVFTEKYIAASAINGLYPAFIRCIIITCDEAYARYYNATQGIDFSSIIPGTEPLQVYSNMSNHIGIIASYNVCGEVVFDVK
ncbi:MAG: DUF4249 family protein [Bacteroidota bacterium]